MAVITRHCNSKRLHRCSDTHRWELIDLLHPPTVITANRINLIRLQPYQLTHRNLQHHSREIIGQHLLTTILLKQRLCCPLWPMYPLHLQVYNLYSSFINIRMSSLRNNFTSLLAYSLRSNFINLHHRRHQQPQLQWHLLQ